MFGSDSQHGKHGESLVQPTAQRHSGNPSAAHITHLLSVTQGKVMAQCSHIHQAKILCQLMKATTVNSLCPHPGTPRCILSCHFLGCPRMANSAHAGLILLRLRRAADIGSHTALDHTTSSPGSWGQSSSC